MKFIKSDMFVAMAMMMMMMMMMMPFVISGLGTDTEEAVMFEEWMKEHNKTYASDEEKAHRFEIFKGSLRFIEEHNSKKLGYTVGLSRFSDLTQEEYKPCDQQETEDVLEMLVCG